MAFSIALRRALSAAAPLAARTVARRMSHHVAATVPLLRLSTLRSLSSQRLSFSTLPSDSNLLSVIDAEIQCAIEAASSDEGGDIPSKFPFEINDEPGKGIITLTRDFHGENIQVIVSMPGVEDDQEVDEDGDDKQQDENTESSATSIPLIVTVSKGNGPSLEFSCTAYPDDITIDNLSVKEPDMTDEDLAYEGPEFTDLDENLQKAFHKYLEIRGITAATTNFLHEYMINKDNKEYISWMKNLKKFLEK